MNRYSSGARFERKIIQYLLKKGALLVMRGAGSKAYGNIKADIVALIPSPTRNFRLLIIQAKHSKKNQKKAKEEFENQNLADWIVLLWLDKKDWKKKIDIVL
jgi:Holliday junction resolvase